jgi:hypothetical protein
MKLFVLDAVCPTCGISFVLKGSKLKAWILKKQKHPERKGPFCHYKCSAKYNAKRASDSKRLEKLTNDITFLPQ